MFMKALDAMGKLDDPFFGNIPPDETVKLVFNLSQDEDVGVRGTRSPISISSPIRSRKAACLRPRSMRMMKATTRGQGSRRRGELALRSQRPSQQ